MAEGAPDPQAQAGSDGVLRAFGEYRLIRRLAAGGMADIFLAKQLGPMGFERDVVIKRLKPDLYERGDFLEMFLDEARLAARLSHPNIVQIHDVGCISGRYFLCMEYLSGEDLQYLLNAAIKRNMEVPPGLAAQMVAQAALGLQYAHELEDVDGSPLNLVHRDISPSNLFVTYQGHVKLLDFGIARARSTIIHTAGGRVKGKTPYLAPELLNGAPASPRSDLYALGLTLYVTLSGTHPFLRDHPMATMRAICDETPLPIQAHRPDVTDELAQIVEKTIARDPAERYQSAGELAGALEHYLMDFTSSNAKAALRSWTLRVVGAERVKRRSLVPKLADLQASGSLVTGFTETPRQSGTTPTPAPSTPPQANSSTPAPATPAPSTPVALLPPPLPPKKGTGYFSGRKSSLSPFSRLGRVVFVAAACVLIAGAATWARALVRRPEAPLQISASEPRTTRPAAHPTLEVQCDADDATVEVDGNRVGTCPVELAIEPGRHEVVARAEGRDPVTEKVEVSETDDRRTVLISFPEAAADTDISPAHTTNRVANGRLTLDTVPWTRVYRGHQLLGETPVVEEALPPGKHRLRLRNPEQGIDQFVDVYVGAGGLTVKRLKLR